MREAKDIRDHLQTGPIPKQNYSILLWNGTSYNSKLIFHSRRLTPYYSILPPFTYYFDKWAVNSLKKSRDKQLK